jgi:hypothetical protein
MASDPDRELARIYADPMLSPDEKARRLQAFEMVAPTRMQPPPDRLARFGREEIPTMGAPGPAPTATDAPPPNFTSQPLPPMVGPSPGGGFDLNAAAIKALNPPQTMTEEGDAVPREDPGVTEYDQANGFNQFLDRTRGFGGAGRVTPQESVTEQSTVEQGALNPGQLTDFGSSLAARDSAEVERQRLQQEMDHEASRIATDARAQAEREQSALEQQKADVYEITKGIRDKQDAISAEIMAADPVTPNLWAGKNFGEKLLTGLSVALMAIGAGASGRPDIGIAQVQALANREVDRQAAWLRSKRGQSNELGSIIERHFANLGDFELAKKATQADILGKAELELMKLANDAAVPLDQAKLEAFQQGLQAERIRLLGAATAELGDKVRTARSVSFTQEHKPQVQAGAPQAVAPQVTPNAPQGSGLKTLQSPSGAPPSSAPHANAPQEPQAAQATFEERWNKGDFDGAFKTLPAGVRQSIMRRAKLIEKEDKLDAKSALAKSIETTLGVGAPRSFVPPHALPRVVHYDGLPFYASDKETAHTLKPILRQESSIVTSLRRLRVLAGKPGSSLSAADKTFMKTFSDNIAPLMAVAQGQGAMAGPEQVIYHAAAGGHLSDWLVKPGAMSAIDASIEASRIRANSLLRDTTIDPDGQRPYRPGRPR